MPFKSEAQRKFLYANHPDVASEFAHPNNAKKGKQDAISRRLGNFKKKKKKSHG